MKITNLFLLFALMAILVSCQKDELAETAVNSYERETTTQTVLSPSTDMAYHSTSTTTPCGNTTIVDFYAGQHILIGNMTMSNTNTDLVITVNTTDGWQLGHTHLYVGAAAAMPTNGAGNPMIGRFPYSTPHNPMVNTYSWSIPLANLDSCFAVALHADVHLIGVNGDTLQSETGWGDGEQFTDAGSWASYYTYCVEDCCDINEETFTIYGGQTIPVGDLVVVNDDNNLYVTWELNSCWSLNETHLYVGDAANIPTNNANTPIPGQFPLQATHNGTSTYTYTIPLSSLPACYAIAAHASVTSDGSCSGTTGGQQETAWSFGTDFPNTNRWGWYSSYCTQSCD